MRNITQKNRQQQNTNRTSRQQQQYTNTATQQLNNKITTKNTNKEYK